MVVSEALTTAATLLLVLLSSKTHISKVAARFLAVAVAIKVVVEAAAPTGLGLPLLGGLIIPRHID